MNTDLMVSTPQKHHTCYIPYSFETPYKAAIFIILYFTLLHVVVKNASIFAQLIS